MNTVIHIAVVFFIALWLAIGVHIVLALAPLDFTDTGVGCVDDCLEVQK